MSAWWEATRYQMNRRWLRNPASSKQFRSRASTLSPVQEQVVQELRRSGVSTVPFAQLFGDPGLWTSLSSAADQFASGEEVRAAIEGWRTGERVGKQKGYLIRLFPENLQIGLENPWLALALDRRVLDIVNAYYGMLARLFALDLWYTIQDTADRSRRGSQKWHRDPEDLNVLKVFLYFTDVTDGSGPLEYVTHSRLGERNCHTTYAGSAWRRSEEEFSRVEERDVFRCVGPRGTLVFCDTAGIHRGGFAVDGPRVLATWGYTTPASLHPRRFAFRGAAPSDPSAAFAVACP